MNGSFPISPTLRVGRDAGTTPEIRYITLRPRAAHEGSALLVRADKRNERQLLDIVTDGRL